MSRRAPRFYIIPLKDDGYPLTSVVGHEMSRKEAEAKAATMWPKMSVVTHHRQPNGEKASGAAIREAIWLYDQSRKQEQEVQS